MHNKLAGIVSIATVVWVVAFPGRAAAQLDLGSAARITFNGSMDLSDSPSGVALIGASWVTEGGVEFGGDIVSSFSGDGADGFGFFRGGYNFIGESLTVPFVTAGIGFPLKPPSGSTVYLYEAGAGIKRFFNERASFDVVGNWRGALSGGIGAGGGSLSMQFGMSVYF